MAQKNSFGRDWQMNWIGKHNFSAAHSVRQCGLNLVPVRYDYQIFTIQQSAPNLVANVKFEAGRLFIIIKSANS